MKSDTAPISDTDSFDLALCFTEEVVNDLAYRQLNDPLTLDPHSPSFLPRRILKNEAQRQAPFAFDWGLPQVSCSEGGLLAAAIPLSGGVRPPALNRNLTLSGSATVRAPVRVANDDMGTFYAAIDASAARALELGDTRLGYALVDLPTSVPAFDPGSVVGLLRPALAPALLESLARIRLSYTLDSLPLGLPDARARQENYGDQTEWAFEATRANAWVITNGDEKALALGITLAGGGENATSDPARMSATISGFRSSPASNMALTLSNGGMNSLLTQLEVAGRLRGMVLSSAGSQPVACAWEGMTCAFEERVVAVAGRFTAGALVDDVRLLLTCALDERGELVIEWVGRVVNPQLNDLAIESFRAILRGLFCAAGAHEDEARLWQRFTVAGTRVKVEAPAEALLLAHDALTLLYQAPLTSSAPSLPDVQIDPLNIMLSQRDLPEQRAYGTPVTAEMEAALSGAIQPVELAWAARPPAMISASHDSVARVTSAPHDVSGDGVAQKLADVTVRAADLLGRTTMAAITAQYRTGSRRRQSKSSRPPARSPLRFILITTLIIAILVGEILAFLFLRPQPGLPPVISVSPTTSYQQTCMPAAPTLTPTTVTLDNTHSPLAIAWSAQVQGVEPGRSAEAWAFLNKGGATASGVIGGGHTQTLIMTPASDLCDAIFSASGQQTFTVAITYRLASQGSQRPDTLAATAGLAPLAARSREITLTDAIFAVRFSAYMGAKERPALELFQACNGLSTPAPTSFPVILDNSLSTAPVQWTLTIPSGGATGVGYIASAPVDIESWATFDTPSGTLDAGQQAQVLVTPAPDLCQRIPAGTTAIPFEVTVTVNGVAPITLLDVVTPPAPAANLMVTPLSLAQDCGSSGSGGVIAFQVTLDNSQSNVPVSWQASVVESLTIGNTAFGTPTPPTIEPWATLDVSSGVLQPGQGGAATFVVTPSAYVCGSVPLTMPPTTEAFHVLITYSAIGGVGGSTGAGTGGATGAPTSGAVVVTDEVSGNLLIAPA